jgi:putative oxidoreductase
MDRFISVAARILLAQIFLVAVIIQLLIIMKTPTGYDDYQVFLGQHGLPGICAPLTIIIQLAGGTALFLGYKTRLSAFVMAGYAVFVAFALDFNEPIVFMQYLAISGGLLALAKIAPTACSLDNLFKKS